MAQKFVAAFLICMVVLAAVQVQQTQAAAEVYKACYKSCERDCESGGQGYTFCEMKCDTDCAAKEVAAKLEKIKDAVKNWGGDDELKEGWASLSYSEYVT